ncbi:UNVERIFIED_CONTAM: hypothetical protein NCL1_57332 [Trichonephila clavipes]
MTGISIKKNFLFYLLVVKKRILLGVMICQ